jgi:hypothetical protein
MVSRGKFVLHSRAVPPLTAGDYLLQGTQTLTTGGSRPTAPYEAHLRVTSPRFKLPPDQILSTYPPANSAGAYESRLPQIVIKRRTLPWERAADPADRKVPWLALVVIAEGEGQISAEVPIADCVTPGIQLAGPNDVARGIYLSVPKTTVTKVFPTKQDLPLLAHVREVDLEDTELAMGDDDGFLAVVMANRLPQYDRVACKPVRYTACLINLEGQLDVLPPPSTPVRHFAVLAEVFNVQDYYQFPDTGGGSPDKVVMAEKAQPAAPVTGAAKAKAPTAKQATSAAPRPGVAEDWRATTKKVENVALNTASAQAASAVRDAMKAGFRLPIEGTVAEPVYRFPILAHWSFTCDGGGSFESLMRAIDVGLLGTLPGPGATKARPECMPPPKDDAPPAAPLARPAREVAETGHVGLAHQTRAGDAVRAWYRGPFVPSPTDREFATTPRGPALAHTSDQLRAVVPDGREDLSLAIAFEIGRLLALSRPAFVSALMQWRREQFGAERARRLAGRATANAAKLADVLKDSTLATFGPLLGKTLVVETAVKRDAVLGPERPPVDPGRPIDFLQDDVPGLLSVGLAIDAAVFETLRRTASANALDGVEVPLDKTVDDATRIAHLTQTLRAEVDRIATDALGGKRPETGGIAARAKGAKPTDALDDLIFTLIEKRKRET